MQTTSATSTGHTDLLSGILKVKPDVFKHPEGAAHKAIRQALGGAYFSFHNSQ